MHYRAVLVVAMQGERSRELDKERNEHEGIFRNNGLTLVLLAAFVVCQGGVSVVGLARYNDERVQHHEAEVDYLGYLQSSDSIEITMENWESEFLQMFAYIE